MTVLEVVKKYNIEDFEKTYNNQYGNSCNLMKLDELMNMEVKSINIHFPTKAVKITVIQHEEGMM